MTFILQNLTLLQIVVWWLVPSEGNQQTLTHNLSDNASLFAQHLCSESIREEKHVWADDHCRHVKCEGLYIDGKCQGLRTVNKQTAQERLTSDRALYSMRSQCKSTKVHGYAFQSAAFRVRCLARKAAALRVLLVLSTEQYCSQHHKGT